MIWQNKQQIHTTPNNKYWVLEFVIHIYFLFWKKTFLTRHRTTNQSKKISKKIFTMCQNTLSIQKRKWRTHSKKYFHKNLFTIYIKYKESDHLSFTNVFVLYPKIINMRIKIKPHEQLLVLDLTIKLTLMILSKKKTLLIIRQTND